MIHKFIKLWYVRALHIYNFRNALFEYVHSLHNYATDIWSGSGVAGSDTFCRLSWHLWSWSFFSICRGGVGWPWVIVRFWNAINLLAALLTSSSFANLVLMTAPPSLNDSNSGGHLQPGLQCRCRGARRFDIKVHDVMEVHFCVCTKPLFKNGLFQCHWCFHFFNIFCVLYWQRFKPFVASLCLLTFWWLTFHMWLSWIWLVLFWVFCVGYASSTQKEAWLSLMRRRILRALRWILVIWRFVLVVCGRSWSCVGWCAGVCFCYFTYRCKIELL